VNMKETEFNKLAPKLQFWWNMLCQGGVQYAAHNIATIVIWHPSWHRYNIRALALYLLTSH